MTVLLVNKSWKQHQGVMPTSASDVLAAQEDTAQMQEARAWTHKLRQRENTGSLKPNDAVRSPTVRVPANKPMVVETSSKKHRFSLRRLFKHEGHDRATKVAVLVPPVPIPTDFLTQERHGAVTVSGKRVPFTRDACKSRQKTAKPLPCINEERAIVPVTSRSHEAYRRRAYYPAKKEKAKKRPTATLS